ncbi:MAG: hypothetical protein KJ970_03200 [Candidatus Eisenbacteria bacterium]|uniref:Uncharacterized protein n=1 Tax=Eiseniibacteriota bacterium TaxID=2212470 RepID=A0A948RUQ4_UNCEI|nr:hypothetical protein [Candidatus Eisenbacteria bacterium]MBU1950020.1 hypothetical protein [Candidatus Eisenbacteria bacterium]MBU2689908.1 hypothetical protein [Candidatus Eisenbacteria bacterium]
MKSRKRTLLYLGFILFVGLLVAGCGDDVNQPEPGAAGDDYSDLELNDPNGGYIETDEPEIVSDPFLMDLVGSEGYADDPLQDDPDILEALADSSLYDLYVIRAAWGVLPVADEASLGDAPEVDWSGSFTCSEGALLALRKIRFERDDRFVRPRTAPDTLEFVSSTFGHFDAVLILLAIKSDESDGTETLTLTTEPFTHTWTLADLDSLNEVYGTSIVDHQVSIVSFSREAGSCERGFVMGQWKGDREDRGVFRGVWLGYNGTAYGFLKGHYGQRNRTQPVLFGKYFDGDGDFLGFIRGSYSHREPNSGRFRALWIDPDDVELGGMSGHWVSVPAARRGFFNGRWGIKCEDNDG